MVLYSMSSERNLSFAIYVDIDRNLANPKLTSESAQLRRFIL